MDKKDFTETDIRTKYITPAIKNAGWDIQRQIREEYFFTNGKIMVRGKTVKRGKRSKVDYILYYKPNLPLAIIEAKDNNQPVGAGMQQGIGYAEALEKAKKMDIPFVYTSNGDSFVEHDRTGLSSQIEKEISLDQFPSPENLYQRYLMANKITPEEEGIVTSDYYFDLEGRSPRYYQEVAINRTVKAIAKGQNRVLLVMATGTGKTYVAFQSIWRLWKSGLKKRILFLADRNILLDQAMINDFKHFGDKMTKVKGHNIDKSYEIYLSLYQGVTGTEEERNVYKQFSPDFFDLIVIDECHRGSAKADSAWREILEYFSSASQVGLTATPKETKDISNIDYFGKPIYTYSLKEGIEDGFLAPYKVVRVTIDRDVEGYRPEQGKLDKYGNELPDENYNVKDFDRTIVIDERIQIVAKKVTEFLKATDRFSKTIVFCVDIDHAVRMRQAFINENQDLFHENSKYIMRITGDNEIGKMQLDNFIDPESIYPVIVTTSKLLTTGVDAQTCKIIVLDSNIQSMTEFKQIIGRGTRIREDYGKSYFTILDFRNVTALFADKDFDGEPVQIYEPKEDEPINPPDDVIVDVEGGEITEEGKVITDYPEPPFDGGDITNKPKKYYVNNVEVRIINERVQYLGKDGKLITESLKDYTKKTILKDYQSLDDFLQKWHSQERKEAVIRELEDQGVIWEALQEEVGKDLDPLDMICDIVYGKPALTRSQRARNVRKNNYFDQYGEQAKKVLESLLAKYEDEGIAQIEDIKILNIDPFRQYGTPMEIINVFGGREQYLQAVSNLENQIYANYQTI